MRRHTAKRPQAMQPDWRRARMEELLLKIRLEREEILRLMELERKEPSGKTA